MNYSFFEFMKSREPTAQKLRFDHAMAAVDEVIKLNQRQLPAMIRLLMRPISAEYARHAFFYEQHIDKVNFELDKFFFSTTRPITEDGCSLLNLPGYKDDPCKPSKQYKLDLARDVVIAQPWNREHLIEGIANIGALGLKGKFSAGCNHQVYFLLPIGLAWTEGGNHSIAAGLGDGFGSLVTRQTFDLSVAYPHVFYDGTSFRRKHDGVALSKPKNEEAGILFEIGRRMLDVGVVYDAPLATKEEFLTQVTGNQRSFELSR